MTFAVSPEAAVPARAADAPAIILESASVTYRVPSTPALTLKEHVIGRLRGRRDTWFDHRALDSVTLEVNSGETLGVIGANGSGKTTLLRLLARVLSPTSGRVRTRGRVAAILDIIGALHPELTGRENVMLNGALFGLSRRDILARLGRIIEFAEIGPFIDAPVHTYSSGMMARLGFAVASDVEADILLVDEALGVGDERFQRKCAARVDEIRSGGAAFVLVSHDLGSVLRLCTRVLWLDRGRVRQLGPAADVVNAFIAAQ